MLPDFAYRHTITLEVKDGVPRTLRSAPRKRRGALLIRGPSSRRSRLCGATFRCAASGTRKGVLDMTRHRSRDLPVVPIRRSPLPCAVGQITSTSLGRPALFQERRFAIVTDVGRGLRWTPLARQDEARGKRTAKSCGPGLSTLRSTRGNASHCAGMVTTRPDHQGEHEGNR